MAKDQASLTKIDFDSYKLDARKSYHSNFKEKSQKSALESLMILNDKIDHLQRSLNATPQKKS